MSSAQNQYLFQASLPALGYNTYYFEAIGKDQSSNQRTILLFHFQLTDEFRFFPIVDTKKIEGKKVTATANEACILENEVGQIFQSSC